MTTTGDGLNTAAEIAKLRGDMAAGFARMEGQLNLIAQAQDRTAGDLEDLEKRVSALEARRWPLGPVAAVSGSASALAAAVALFIVR